VPCLRGYGANRTYQQLLTTSPNGLNWLYEELVEKHRNDVKIIRGTARDNPFLPNDYTQTLSEQLSSKMALQEIEGQFVSFTEGAVFWAWDRKYITEEPNVKPTEGKLFLAMDENVSPLAGVWGRYTADKLWVAGEIAIKDNANWQDIVRDFMAVAPKEPFDLFGDSSGNKRTTVSSKSFYNLIVEAFTSSGWNISLRVNKSNPSVVETCDLVNKKFEDGIIKLNTSCRSLANDLSNVLWKPGSREIWKTKYDGHWADAFRYAIYSIWKKKKSSNFSMMKV
jgi:hypothetical protein